MTLFARTAAGLLLATGLVSLPASAQDNILDGGRVLQTSLTGGGTGDPDGFGTATIVVNPGQNSLCFDIEVSGIEPSTKAHLHVVATQAIAVPLDPPTSGSSEGCVEGLDRQLVLSILKHPEDYFVNIHNTEYPGGALSGTLSH